MSDFWNGDAVERDTIKPVYVPNRGRDAGIKRYPFYGNFPEVVAGTVVQSYCRVGEPETGDCAIIQDARDGKTGEFRTGFGTIRHR